MKIEESRETDLLIGIVSKVGDKHYFLADFDKGSKKEIMNKVGKVLFDKYKFGNCYLIKSGRGWHLANFSKKLSLEDYVKILKEIGACNKFIEWVEKVKYGVLRVSRRSSHFLVPKLVAVLKSPYNEEENIFLRNFYFSILELEENYTDVKRVRVFEFGDKKN
jgi:hypothetical protein